MGTISSRQNYQRLLDARIAEWTREGRRPHVLLHVCCAPCSSAVLESLSRHCRITVFYYNPNITDADEYRHRADEVRRLIGELRGEDGELLASKYGIEFMEGAFEPRRFLEAVHGLEHEPEGGRRCEVCFRLRLGETARVAEQIGAEYMTTSLTISPLKDATLLNTIGEQLGGARWLPSDFKKKSGYLRSIELSREYNLYRQNYCGCIFSRQK